MSVAREAGYSTRRCASARTWICLAAARGGLAGPVRPGRAGRPPRARHVAGLLARRYRYGTSAARTGAAASGRHRASRSAALACRDRRRAAGPAALGAAAALRRRLGEPGYRLRRAEVPRAGLTKATLTATRQTWLGLGRYGTQFAAPLLVAAIAAPGRMRRRARPAGGPGRTWAAPRGVRGVATRAIGARGASGDPAGGVAAGRAAADRLGGGVADAGSASVHAGPDRRRYRLRGWRLVGCVARRTLSRCGRSSPGGRCESTLSQVVRQRLALGRRGKPTESFLNEE